MKLVRFQMPQSFAITHEKSHVSNIQSLKKNSIDFYAATKSLYLQNKDRKIKNISGTTDDNWKDLD